MSCPEAGAARLRVWTLHAPLLLLLLSQGSSALYAADGPVQLLNHQLFGVVEDSPVPCVVEFYAHWDGLCQAIAETYTAVAAELKDIVPFVAFDCNEREHYETCHKYRIRKFPTILLFKPGRGKPQDLHVPHTHPFTADALRKAALGLLTEEHLKHFDSQPDAVEWLGAPGTRVVYVSPHLPVEPWIKSASQRFLGQLRFAQVRKVPLSAPLLAYYGLTEVPAMAALTADGSKVVYEGPFQAPEIMHWLHGLARAEAGAGRAAQQPAGADQAAAEDADEGPADEL